jgi:hypothetical protein
MSPAPENGNALSVSFPIHGRRGLSSLSRRSGPWSGALNVRFFRGVEVPDPRPGEGFPRRGKEVLAPRNSSV